MHTMIIDSWAEVSARRAETYQFFSSLYAKELTREQVSSLQQGELSSLLTPLSVMGLEEEVSAVNKSIALFEHIDDIALELAADFAALFLLDGETSAIPYASRYLDKTAGMYGGVESIMSQFLAGSGLGLIDDFKEPADHLSVYLALIGHWIKEEIQIEGNEIKELMKKQYDFIQDGLMAWLSLWIKKLVTMDNTVNTNTIHTKTQFYQEMSLLLCAFIKEDLAYLASIQG